MAETTAQRIAGEVRAQLARQAKTGRGLAAALGMSQPAVSRRLRGELPFDVDELQRVADFLDVPMSTFIGTEPDRAAS